jgi:hypothetical protein
MQPHIDTDLTENPFLVDLLTLQQDGSAAISAPATWNERPLLQVETDLDHIVDGLVQSIIAGAQDRDVARWHFFVGSPGNGKSAGIGELARKLQEASFVVTDAEGINLGSVSPTSIPYKLQVRGSGQDYAIAYIAQDASVVPDPYADNANPALALIDLLKESEEKGISLIVCTNRGVLERAFSLHYLNRDSAGKLWFTAIRSAVMGQEGFSRDLDVGSRRTFRSVQFTYATLDRRSLLVGRSTFSKLVERAVDPLHWSACDCCPSQGHCPFFQNRKWLLDPQAGKSFVRIIKHAEILSGQVVVFREALALLSLILAGCPHDYVDGSPCRWVHSRASAGMWFSLLSRRVYMTLFAAFSPYGLEPDSRDRAVQQSALAELASAIVGPSAKACQDALAEVTAPIPALSTNVGVERLVGASGVLRVIDCESDILPKRFYDLWDLTGPTQFMQTDGHFSDLERKCADVWTLLRDTAESSDEVSGDSYRWLARWVTSHTHRAGCLLGGYFTFASEIETLVKILSLGQTPDDEGLTLVEQIEGDLWKMLHSSGEGTQISPFSRLKGEWVRSHLRPSIERPREQDSQSIVLTLTLSFPEFSGHPVRCNDATGGVRWEGEYSAPSSSGKRCRWFVIGA